MNLPVLTSMTQRASVRSMIRYLLDLGFDAVQVEERTSVRVEVHPIQKSRRGDLQLVPHLGVFHGVVDDQPVDVGSEEVAKHLVDQGQLLVDQSRSPPLAGRLLNLVPDLDQIVEVPLEVLLGSSGGCRAHDDPHPFGSDLLGADPQAVALLLVQDPPRDPDVLGRGEKDQIAPGKGHVGRDAGPLGPHGLLDDLDQGLLVDLQDVGDRHLAQGLVDFISQMRRSVICAQEAVALQADVHEGRIHSRQHVGDAPLVDAAHLTLFASDQDFHHLAVFEHDGPALALVEGNQDFLVHLKNLIRGTAPG
jgi:hypothetical protein